MTDEIDRYLAEASRREESVYSKATFMAVTAGVLLTAIASMAWRDGAAEVLANFAAGLSVLAIICAAVALRPAQMLGLTPSRLWDKYIDSRASHEEIRRAISEAKVRSATDRERKLATRSLLVATGFSILIVAAVIFVVAFILTTN